MHTSAWKRITRGWHSRALACARSSTHANIFATAINIELHKCSIVVRIILPTKENRSANKCNTWAQLEKLCAQMQYTVIDASTYNLAIWCRFFLCCLCWLAVKLRCYCCCCCWVSISVDFCFFVGAYSTLDNMMRNSKLHLLSKARLHSWLSHRCGCCRCSLPLFLLSLYLSLFWGLAYDDAFKIAVRTCNEPKAPKRNGKATIINTLYRFTFRPRPSLRWCFNAFLIVSFVVVVESGFFHRLLSYYYSCELFCVALTTTVWIVKTKKHTPNNAKC